MGHHAVAYGPRNVAVVIHKDVRQIAATGGWGFEGFGGGDPALRVVGSDAAAACFACHTSGKTTITCSAARGIEPASHCHS
jgi:hypothetical protein